MKRLFKHVERESSSVKRIKRRKINEDTKMHSACKYQKRIFKGFCAPKSWFLTPKDSLMHKICNIILSMQSQKLSKNSLSSLKIPDSSVQNVKSCVNLLILGCTHFRSKVRKGNLRPAILEMENTGYHNSTIEHFLRVVDRERPGWGKSLFSIQHKITIHTSNLISPRYAPLW